MQVCFFTAGADSAELKELETGIRNRLPGLQTVTKLDEITRRLTADSSRQDVEKTFIIFPVLTTPSSIDRLVNIAEQTPGQVLFIFVSRDISANDYKRLVRTGAADWVSLKDAPQDIAEIVSRSSKVEAGQAAESAMALTIATFVPSTGGVGNATLATETALQLKADKRTRDRRICVLDLDLQASHVCDYLDIEPRLQMREIIDSPDRLDAQLFDLFVSNHASGVAVLASPRNRTDFLAPNMAALDALFGMVASRFDLLIVDLPPQWSDWTRQILSASAVAIVTGIHTVPGLRQISATLADVRSVDPMPPKIVVGLNRCEPRLLGGIARSHHVTQILGSETVLTVREDTAAAIHANNTGIPMAIGVPSSKISKDIRAFATLVGGLWEPKVKS